MRVLIGYEASGRTREEFRKRGHEAYSCDLLPADDASPYHYQADVWDVVKEDWDLAIFHPTCTYLTSSAEWAYKDGPYHQQVQPGTLVGLARRQAREKDIANVIRLSKLPIKKIAIENPKGILSSRWRKPDQIIHPYMFGDDASKATCLWLKGLDKLEPTHWVPPIMWVWEQGKKKVLTRWSNQTESGQNNLTPGDDRWRKRAETYPGIAAAFGEQWG